jgi:hypothetical protein
MTGFLKDYAVFFSALLSLLAVYVQYRFILRNKKIRLARALKVEIKCMHATQCEQLCESQPKLLEKARLAKEPFVVWYGRNSYPIFDAASADLWLLPDECVATLIRFYERDGLLRGNVAVLGFDNFLKLDPDHREVHINEIFNELHGKYLAAKEEAIEQLSRPVICARGNGARPQAPHLPAGGLIDLAVPPRARVGGSRGRLLLPVGMLQPSTARSIILPNNRQNHKRITGYQVGVKGA